MKFQAASSCACAALVLPINGWGTYAHADIVSVVATQSGNYAASGTGNINSPGFQNYFVGYSTPSATAERRNFFIFPTASFEPITITGATLILYVPLSPAFGGHDHGPGYVSPDPSETYMVTPTFVPASEVGDPTNDPTESAFIWATLGTGPLAGAIEVHGYDQGTYLHIPLTPDAVAALNALGPGSLVLGGRLTSLDHTRPMVLDELVFSFTDILTSDFAPPTLEITYIPAPTAAFPLFLASMLIARQRPRPALSPRLP